MAETPDRELSQQWVEFLEETRSKAGKFLGLDSVSEHRVLIRQVRKLPGGLRLAFHAWVSEGKLDFFIEVTDPLDLQHLRAEIAKIFIYEKILPKKRTWTPGEPLPEIPHWLIEGVTQRLNPIEDEILEKTVSRMVTIQKAPTLKTVLGWREQSSNKLEAHYQKTFCYALLLWQLGEKRERESFWSGLSAGVNRWMDADFEEMESRWMRYLGSFKVRDEQMMSWDETQRSVSNLLFLAAPVESVEKRETYLVKWDELRSIQNRKALIPVLQQREAELLLLESQAHFSWRPFLFCYRSAVRLLAEELVSPPPRKSQASSRPTKEMATHLPVKRLTYEDYVELAKKSLAGVQERASGVRDYLDWFLVSFSSDQDQFMFEDYYKAVGGGAAFEVQGKDLYRQQGIKVEKRGE
jgi:hypothetical protein